MTEKSTIVYTSRIEMTEKYYDCVYISYRND